MQSLKALTKTGAQLGLRSSASLAGGAIISGGVGSTLLESAGPGFKSGWRRLLDEYAGRATSRFVATGPLHRQQEDESKGPQQVAGEARRFTTGGGSGKAGGSGGYALLAAVHGSLAAAAFMAPSALANFFFPGAALPEGFQSQALVKLLGCGLGAGAAASLGLKQLADTAKLASPTAQRLQLGLMGFSAGNVALHALYSPTMAGTAFMAGAAVMAPTFLIPYQHYVKTNAGLKPIEALKSYFGAVPDHFKITGLQSGLYSLLTPVLALAGATYLFAPGMSLAEVFGFVKGVDTFFWWQTIGGGLMTAAPAITFSLKKLADEGRIGEPVAKILNAGVAAAAAGHLAVLGPMVAANQGGPYLSVVTGAWATALVASGLGLMGGGGAVAAKAAGRT